MDYGDEFMEYIQNAPPEIQTKFSEPSKIPTGNGSTHTSSYLRSGAREVRKAVEDSEGKLPQKRMSKTEHDAYIRRRKSHLAKQRRLEYKKKCPLS